MAWSGGLSNSPEFRCHRTGLAVGQVEEKPVVVDGEIVVQPRMRMTLSCDHRVIDGAMGAKFLQTLTDFIEEPMMMLS